jgi:hypothetical protein
VRGIDVDVFAAHGEALPAGGGRCWSLAAGSDEILYFSRALHGAVVFQEVAP